MIGSRACATALVAYMAASPVFAQWPIRVQNQARPSTVPAAQDNRIAMQRRAYDTLVARGNERGAGVAAGQLALAYDQRSDFENAAIWWRTAYSKGYEEGLSQFLNLVISKKITVSNPDGIRPLIEERAFCGSQMARVYLLEHFHETPAQLPDYAHQSIKDCVPASPDDRMDQTLMIQARRRVSQQDAAAYYRLHPEEDPAVEAQQAAAGAALLLGALIIQAAAMPATGPGSIACNKYQNGYPGATDASVCNAAPLR